MYTYIENAFQLIVYATYFDQRSLLLQSDV